MDAINRIREKLPETAKDIKLNLQSVLSESTLNNTQRWGTAIACASAARNADLYAAVLADARVAGVAEETIDDAHAASTIMGMNNVFYRFKHFIGKESYASKPARLRMNYIARPKAEKADFELYCLAVSAVNGCENCVRSHEQVVLEKGLTEDHVWDAVRIAATIHAAAIALES